MLNECRHVRDLFTDQYLTYTDVKEQSQWVLTRYLTKDIYVDARSGDGAVHIGEGRISSWVVLTQAC